MIIEAALDRLVGEATNPTKIAYQVQEKLF